MDEIKIEDLVEMFPELDISWKEIMGEYRLYLDGAQFGLLSEGRLLLMITKESEAILQDMPHAKPYGQQEMIDATNADKELLNDLIPKMCQNLPKLKACRLF